MNEKRLSEHLRQYYEGKRLPAGRLARLAAMAETAPPVQENKDKAGCSPALSWLGLRTEYRFTVAAVLLVAFVGAFLLGRISWEGQDSVTVATNLTKVVAKEIALNHNKRLNVEFSARDYMELRKKMGKLDFPTIASVRLQRGQYQLVGGRYCSIQGQLAAQIKLKDNKGRVHTLYQTPDTNTLAGLAEGERQVDGLRISLWREAGLVFGLASPQD